MNRIPADLFYNDEFITSTSLELVPRIGEIIDLTDVHWWKNYQGLVKVIDIIYKFKLRMGHDAGYYQAVRLFLEPLS